ncbi:MAG: EpsI family protein [Gammaproteobacteria bacterium]|nr:EpsI family protein [Gammaproteobacteria bacterium]MBU1406949.1 EpsI family protein [Gammaproteobacteria bacterium]MBU1533092.1 EpsI family protein [Gammaproteobacteria bacterium]
MKAINPRHFLIGLTMLAAAGLALALTPRLKVADEGSKISLEAMIPTQFGEWKLEDANMPIIGGPEVETLLEKIYSQMLSRTYINGKGERIMLSIAYGSDQSYSSQVHRPEMCYPAQGFQIKGMTKGFIDLSGVKFPVMKLIATQGLRIEPITYWVMMGDSAVRGIWEQHFARLKYGLAGKIPHGIVIRVSTISANESQSYLTQEQFVRDMLGAVPMEYRKILSGTTF